jgi:quinol monooxygenase YgiN
MLKSFLALWMIIFEAVAPAQSGNAVYIATYIDIQSSAVDKGVSLIKQYREQSRAEPGNSAVDVVQEIARPNRFVIIEVWRDQSAFDTHERADHTARFRTGLLAIHNSPFDQRVHRAFAIDSRPVAAGREMVSVVTHVDVPPQRTNETEMLLTTLADESRKDEGNLRYEVFQQAASRNHFTVFAVWKDSRTFNSYETKPHTRQFRTALAPMLGAPYDERLYKQLN